MNTKLLKTNAGMTLLEVSVATAIFTLVMGVILSLSLGIGNVSRVQESQVRMTEGARNAMTRLVTEVRQAQRLSVAINNAFPGASLSYRIAQDVDGNGTAVNRSGALELSALRTIKRDTDDLNGDGKREKQLVLLQGNTVLAVLANNLCPLMETNADGNGNGRLDRGFYVFNNGGTLTISVQTEETLANGRPLESFYSAVVRPRN